ncbi:MAG: YSC84-related protein [Nitrospinota bacterium]|nr:hypothetical protein [Nitrospinota bacterium]
MNFIRQKSLLKISIFIIFFSLFPLVCPQSSQAASADEINIKADATLKLFRKKVPGGSELMAKSKGVLIFPSVIKAGIGIGGEYGEGALRIGGKTVAYYSTAAASVGFQLGAQSKSVILLFLTEESLRDFRKAEGWKAGVDGAVAVVEWGSGQSVDSLNIQDPIVGFVFGNKGLMYNLTIEGSKFTKIIR